MRRILGGLVACVSAFVGLSAAPVGACHFGVGLNCNQPPEQQPYNPQLSITVADDRTAAHSDTTVTVRHNADHEQFTVKLIIDLPPESGIDLDVPAFNEKIADLTIDASLNGAPATLTGRIKDHNEPNNGLHGHPTPDGTYHWVAEIDDPAGGPPTLVDIFVDEKAADGHFHLEFNAPPTLIADAMTADASLRKLETKLFGNVAGGPFLTNPAVAGTYTATAQFTAWDDPLTPQTPPTVTRTANFTIANRVPTSATLAPASATLRVNNPQSFTVTVLDQRNEALAGAAVSFDVTGANPSSGSAGDTDAQGKASFGYTGENGGTDSVTATATKFGTSKTSNTATINWREPKSLALAPASASKKTGGSHTVTATAKDQNGTAMAGETVSFTRSGANPGSGSGVTNASGQTSHTWSGTNPGDDTLSATVVVTSTKSLSATATVHWGDAATVTLSPATASRNVNQTHTVTATVTDDQGNLMEGVTVEFAVTDGPHAGASGPGTTGASGTASFSYQGTAEGVDTIEAAADGASATATVEWTQQSEPTPDDSDGDGIRNTDDNCWNVANPDQADNDGDHFGDACDNDDDNDSLLDPEEAPNGCNVFVKDTDGDGLNDWQEVKGHKTRCDDPDTDDDGLSDGQEIQRGTDPKKPDSDGDGVLDGADNCPTVSNADQADEDGDGKGDRCDGVRICINGICQVIDD